MNDILKKLVALTEVDAAIVKIQEQLGQYPAVLSRMQEAEARQQKAIDEAETVIEAARQDRRKAEKEMQVLQEQIRKYTGQQAAVKTNKEYQAITHEIDGLKGKIDEWETIGLEKLEAEEASANKKKSAAEQLQKIRDENESERRRIEGQIAEKREKVERLNSERGAAVRRSP